MKPSNLSTKNNRLTFIRCVLVCCAILGLFHLAQLLTVRAAETKPLWLEWTWFESHNDYALTGGDGGVSYGRYQFTAGYCLEDFVTYCQTAQPEHYAGLSSGDFDTAWKQAYTDYGAEFAALQDQYALEHYYYPVKSKLLELYGIDLDQYSPVLKGTIMSLAIRNGSNVSLERKTNKLHSATSTYSPGIPEEDWLEAIYNTEAKRRPKQVERWRDNQKAMALEALSSL